MTKKGGGGDLQGEKKKLYSQERKTENKKEVMDTIVSVSVRHNYFPFCFAACGVSR